jgi:hypothetical protein
VCRHFVVLLAKADFDLDFGVIEDLDRGRKLTLMQ